MSISKISIIGVLLLACTAGTQAWAKDKKLKQVPMITDEVMGIECMPAKDFVKILGKLSTLKADKIDTVSMLPKMYFEINDGGAWPERVFFRHERVETPFILNPEGVVTDFLRIKDMHKDGEMCMQDKTRIGVLEDDNGLDTSIDLDLAYHSTSGSHTLAELKDGLDDGRAHIKKIAPAMVSFLIPKFTHMSVSANDGQTLDVKAFKGNEEVRGLNVFTFEGMQMVEFSQLKSLGADRLQISGGSYILGPTPSPKDARP